MKPRGHRAFTLIEILIASVLTLVLGLVIASLFVTVSHMMAVSTSSYLISRDLTLGVEQIRRDLKETALGSINVKNSSNPSVSFVTAYDADDKLSLDSQGAPVWQGWVHTTLDFSSTDGNALTGNLVNWYEYPQSPMTFPVLSRQNGATIPSSAKKKVILRDVVRPGAILKDVQDGDIQLPDNDGFSVKFLSLKNGDYLPTDLNPSVPTAKGGDIQGNTSLVEVTLRTYAKSNTGRSDTIGLRFRLSPRF